MLFQIKYIFFLSDQLKYRKKSQRKKAVDFLQ